jgi:dihydroorotate dehydrogenase
LSNIEHLSDAIELNISSPNTSGLKIFQNTKELTVLLEHVNAIRTKPLFVKLPPYSSSEHMSLNETRDRVLSLVQVCKNNGVDALTVANSQPNKDRKLAVGMGGVSGRIIFNKTVEMVSDVRKEVGQNIAINASGGIFDGRDALQVLKAGASTVQILTALVYRGPGIARAINSELLNEMGKNGLPKGSESQVIK